MAFLQRVIDRIRIERQGAENARGVLIEIGLRAYRIHSDRVAIMAMAIDLELMTVGFDLIAVLSSLLGFVPGVGHVARIGIGVERGIVGRIATWTESRRALRVQRVRM